MNFAQQLATDLSNVVAGGKPKTRQGQARQGRRHDQAS